MELCYNGELFDTNEETCREGVFACPICVKNLFDEDFFWFKLKGLNRKMSKILDEDYFIQGLKNGRPYFRAVLGIIIIFTSVFLKCTYFHFTLGYPSNEYSFSLK